MRGVAIGRSVDEVGEARRRPDSRRAGFFDSLKRFKREQMVPRGGARPGAGRKKGTGNPDGRPAKKRIYESPIREAEGRIRDRLPELVDMALKLALEGEDAKMVVYCIDRILGKPVQPVDMVDRLRDLARIAGLTDEEAAAAVAEAERLLGSSHGTARS